MIVKILRWLLQVILLVTVCFFGYHYLTREELRSCVSVPLTSLNGKSEKIKVNEEQVEVFMANFGDGLKGVVTQGENLWQNLGAANTEASQGAEKQDLADQLIDKGQYLYCKTVVDRVESEE